MALLKPPDPEIPCRKYYVRIEDPLAATMERYAEFLGASTTDHVIGQALQFVFRKDTDFKDWLDHHPQAAPKGPKNRKRRIAAAIGSSPTVVAAPNPEGDSKQ